MGGRTGSASRLHLELDVDPPRPARCEELVRVDLDGDHEVSWAFNTGTGDDANGAAQADEIPVGTLP
jgi:hypothetical protein